MKNKNMKKQKIYNMNIIHIVTVELQCNKN